MEWSDDIIAKLRVLWGEGHSTAEIGRRLNISKNAVVGKAHRLHLPARPSPIRRGDAAPRAQLPRRLQGPTLPPLASVGQASPPALRPITAPPKHSLRAAPCCWPIGEPGKPSFHFCNAPSQPGRPYCEAHAAIAYVRVRDRREDVA